MAFRPMRRIAQQLPDEEAREILAHAKRGVLSLTGDDGYPYGIYLNPFYCPEDGKIYFHGAKEGHKIDAIRRNPRCCFTVLSDGVKDDPGWAYTFRSVVAFGRIELVADQEKALAICLRLARRFNPSEEDIQEEIRRAGARVQVLAMTLEHVTGKRVHEA